MFLFTIPHVVVCKHFAYFLEQLLTGQDHIHRDM